MTNNQLTLEQAIQHTDEKAAALSGPCAEQHKQLAEWLRELQERRRAAMDGESECLPLDYLQGHRDGLEWAAQLAKANHPETGDWLYDDPIELAKAIRKGPDMPPAPTVRDSEPVALTANIERDAQRYRFLRERDAFGDDGEPGIASWDDLIELDTNEFDAAIDARMTHPSVDFITLDNALQKHERRRCKDRNCNKPIYGYSVDGLCEDCYTAVSQRPAPECEHQWRHGGANKLQNQKQCIKCGRVELDAQRAPVLPDERAAFNTWNNDIDCPLAGRDAKSAAWMAWQARAELAGNSPVIPDRWTGSDKANAALMMLDRIETVDPVDDDRIDGIKRIIHELAVAPQEVK